MTQTPKFGTLMGATLRLHWTWLAMPILIVAYSLYDLADWTVFNILLCLAVYLVVFLKTLGQMAFNAAIGLGTRDLIFYPFWTISRYTVHSERPRGELLSAFVGIMLHLGLMGLFLLLLMLEHIPVYINPELQQPMWRTFIQHFFWANVALAIGNLTPILCVDGGRLFRAALARTTGRLRATEIAASLSSLICGLMLILSIFFWGSPLIGVVAVFLFLSTQEDLELNRFFESMKSQIATNTLNVPVVNVPMNEIVNSDTQSIEPSFNGFTWNNESRLWIEWANGQPIAAHALVGD